MGNIIKAYAGKIYTESREELKRQLIGRKPYSFFKTTTVNGIEEIEYKYTRYFQFAPIVSILENPRVGGEIKNYVKPLGGQGTGANFLVHGWTSDELTAADWYYMSGTSKALGRRWGNTENFPHLVFDGSSYLESDGSIYHNSGESGVADHYHSLVFWFTPLLAETLQYIISVEDCIYVRQNADDTVTAGFYSSGWLTATSTATLTVGTSYRIVATYDNLTAKRVKIQINSSSVTGDSTSSTFGGNTKKMYIGCLDTDGTKSNYLTGAVHSLYETAENTFNTDDIAELDAALFPFGYEIEKRYYDDASGTETGVAYSLWKIETWDPYYETYVRQTFNWTDRTRTETLF